MQETEGNIRKFRYFEILVISLFWVLLFASPLLLGQWKNGIDWNHVFKVWKEHFVLLALFLANRILLVPYLFLKQRRVLYVIITFLLIGTAVTGMYLYDRKPEPVFNRRPAENTFAENNNEKEPGLNPPPRNANRQNNPQPQQERRRRARRQDNPMQQPEPIPAYINLLILSVLVFGFDTGLKTASKWVYSEQQRIILEKENIETQLAFLRHQINPHFFMNTLNNIHSLIDLDATEAKRSVIRLSSLMRHLLYESDQELSPMRNEVEFIRSYVDLMKLRYSKDVRISVTIPEEIPEKSIPPLLFISLLENAFKHGISYMQKSFVEIELSFFPDKLHLTITNSKSKESPKAPSSGIGIENTRKRLDLLYKEDYSLEVIDKGTSFVTNLIIPV